MATNNERITANNARLSALVETAEALPDAGGGGGVETCTLCLKLGDFFGTASYTTVVDGSIRPAFVERPEVTSMVEKYEVTIEAVKGSMLVISMVDSDAELVSATGAQRLYENLLYNVIFGFEVTGDGEIEFFGYEW